MFTGIVDHVGEIVQLTQGNDCLRLQIKCNFNDLELGESISVDGICLTVTDITPLHFSCDVSPETIASTTIKHKKPGAKVNLERALRSMDRLGGHFVLGHVDCVAQIKTISKIGDFIEMTIGNIPAEYQAYLIKKGSIGINGTSLTINQVMQYGFQVMLIPHTQERTNLELLIEGDEVNIEFDYIARVIVQQLRPLNEE